MKIFHRDKYKFVGLQFSEYDRRMYFAFSCIKSNFSPEIVLVDEAKIVYGPQNYVYLNEFDIEYANRYREHYLKDTSFIPYSSCVNFTSIGFENLAVNESNRCSRRAHSTCSR